MVLVSRDPVWVVVWGAVGGALGLFLQFGGIVLGVASITLQLWSKLRPPGSAGGGTVTPAQPRV